MLRIAANYHLRVNGGDTFCKALARLDRDKKKKHPCENAEIFLHLPAGDFPRGRRDFAPVSTDPFFRNIFTSSMNY